MPSLKGDTADRIQESKAYLGVDRQGRKIQRKKKEDTMRMPKSWHLRAKEGPGGKKGQ